MAQHGNAITRPTHEINGKYTQYTLRELLRRRGTFKMLIGSASLQAGRRRVAAVPTQQAMRPGHRLHVNYPAAVPRKF